MSWRRAGQRHVTNSRRKLLAFRRTRRREAVARNPGMGCAISDIEAGSFSSFFPAYLSLGARVAPGDFLLCAAMRNAAAVGADAPTLSADMPCTRLTRAPHAP